ncbi:hypothetical protein [Periweissella fabalis]|uniref:Uncharacterized protein n=1 Tax=Periweissella fabalis TaxID=1070421 RepID=A0A7X6N6K5_9LACO|nr:hypothetical protein [Periweissella fabalis]MCM0598308.1 hypothetical protein [Periweissella fabalis]NKZ24940.1 hypothetical protein [Periweissella fabalis]
MMNIDSLNNQLKATDDRLNQVFKALKDIYLIDSTPAPLVVTQELGYDIKAYTHLYNSIEFVIGKLTALVDVLDSKGFTNIDGTQLTGVSPIWPANEIGLDSLNDGYQEIISDLQQATNKVVQAAKINGLSI